MKEVDKKKLCITHSYYKKPIKNMCNFILKLIFLETMIIKTCMNISHFFVRSTWWGTICYSGPDYWTWYTMFSWYSLSFKQLHCMLKYASRNYEYFTLGNIRPCCQLANLRLSIIKCLKLSFFYQKRVCANSWGHETVCKCKRA